MTARTRARNAVIEPQFTHDELKMSYRDLSVIWKTTAVRIPTALSLAMIAMASKPLVADPNGQTKAPLRVEVELADKAARSEVLPLAIKITNVTHREILLSFNAEFLPDFEFTQKGAALVEIVAPWAPSIESPLFRLQPGASYSAWADLSQFVGLVAAGRGEVTYKARLYFWDVREDGAAAEAVHRFDVEGNLVIDVTADLVEKAKRRPRIGWTIKPDK